MKLFKILGLAVLLALTIPACEWDNPFSEPDPPPQQNPNSFNFTVSVDAYLSDSTPGVEGDITAVCSPVINPNSGSPATYKLTVDGVSSGNATGTNTFLVQNVPPRVFPGYPVICEHEATNSRSDADYVVVP